MPQHPNILFITSDQHRADTMSGTGHPVVETPNLDSLGYDGMRFDRAYVDCPVCIPARTALITGRQAHHNGMPAYGADYRLERGREKFLGSLLTAAGYQTELVGKTHWHTEPDFRAGFEHVTWLSELRRQRLLETRRTTTLDGLGANEIKAGVSEFPPHLYSTNWIVDRCIDFLGRRERGQPFLLWASFIDPHPPFAIHEPFYSRYRPEDMPPPRVPDWIGTDTEPRDWHNKRHSRNPKPYTEAEIRHARAVYGGMVTNLDQQLGRLFGKLIADGDWENTWVVYTSDHGEMLGDYGLLAKSNFCEASARVPFILRPPSGVPGPRGTVSDALVQWVDLLPTLCDIAGAEVPEDVDGRSLLPVLEGRRGTHHEEIHGQIGDSHMLVRGGLKYLYFADDGSELLFDLEADPHEQTPVTDARLGEMRRDLVRHLSGENHEHVRDGELFNRGDTKLPPEELRRWHLGGRGLANAAAMTQIERPKN